MLDIPRMAEYYGVMTLQERKAQLNKAVDKSETALLAFTNKHRGAMGLTSDAATSTDTYKKLKAAFNSDFAALRAFNSTYRKELRRA